jgi:hypothetical protein
MIVMIVGTWLWLVKIGSELIIIVRYLLKKSGGMLTIEGTGEIREPREAKYSPFGCFMPITHYIPREKEN